MLSHETALKLKELGFPQKDKRCSYCIEQGGTSCSECEDSVESDPTLEELIEACGDKFKDLARLYENRWGCNSSYLFDENVDSDTVFDGLDYDFTASSPIEAVAQLYISLKC